MVSHQTALGSLLTLLTARDNAFERKELTLLSASQRGAYSISLGETLRDLEISREDIDGDVGLLLAFQCLWRLVPQRLFEGLDPNYESLARSALNTYSGGTSRERVNQLAVVFRRIRSSHFDGRASVTKLDLSRRRHSALLDDQDTRCALCGYPFRDGDLLGETELGVEYFEQAYDAKRGEVTLEKYYRKAVLDHIIPYFIGGDGSENWQILCFSCNAGKGDAISWITRRGWMPAQRVGDVVKLTSSMRYAALARYRSTRNAMQFRGGEMLRLFRRDPNRLIMLDNLLVEKE